ncbi:hypothetical protein CcaverHIS002_0403620 [Cutaneotrichosporon cavernicola]|nr:hypothetical protein CcaverHIS002_0403620 [Cutaneotrichosporon cavernicola]BEI99314.1 hypothetical protein CcaverHIS631_0403570 [Cutaneotrichosporon cavernicola]BEJ07090.1 hypothetical protein CcaverHIS641_0403590 [Cutaneotrichosporon cavernicola]
MPMIQGDSTAQWAPGPYVPPFKYSEVPALRPQVTGVGTAPGAVPTGSADTNPVIPANVPTQTYALYYLMTHMTSWPSYRYQYLFWFVVAGVAILYAVAHHIRLSGGSLGAGYTKWGMRRVSIGRAYALPSVSTLLVGAAVGATAIVLSIVGDDYIAPALHTFQFAKRGSVATNTLAKRVWIGGPMDSSLLVQNNISKSGWTLGNRFGFMAFAMLPLVVLLAAKAPPFAIFSWKWFTHLYSDKLISFHRAAGWLVWGLTTAHVVFWTIQLFKDKDRHTQRAMWFTAFQIYRFTAGCIAYGLMTLMVVLSQRPVRKSGYEFFYHAHVTLTFLTLVACCVHHPALWWWVVLALVIFLGDRLFRALRFARINRGAAKGTTVRSGTYSGLSQDDMALENFSDKMLPPTPAPYDASEYSTPNPYEQPYGVVEGYGGTPEIMPMGTFDSRSYDDSALQPPQRNASLPAPSQRPRATSAGHHRSVPASTRTAHSLPPVIPPGYAQAQLLPSRTVRLTIRTPQPLKWAPGQSLHLTLPELSKIQAHPFTISNNNPSEIVVLVKARKGLTRQLYNLVRKRSEASMGLSDKQVGNRVAPIYVRALVDGPMGSAGRVRWGDFASVLLVCGGTGVTFGLAILDHVCNMIQRGDFKSKIRRVRFLWVAREYAQIAWAASALCRARQMVPSTTQLQIDVYVTNAAPQGYSSTTYHAGAYGDSDFALPRPSFATQGDMKRAESVDSMGSMMSGDPRASLSSARDNFDYADEEMAHAGGSIVDYTNYEDEDDINDPAESELSRKIQKQGKLRRAKTRKVEARRIPSDSGYAGSSVYPPSPGKGHSQRGSTSSSIGLPPGASYSGDLSGERGGLLAEPVADPRRRSLSAGAYEHRDRDNLLYPDPNPDPRRISGRSMSSSHYESNQALLTANARDPRRQSYRSVSSSMYDRYDPYNPDRISPSPSGLVDDRDAVSVLSRTQSMVFFEDTGDEPLMGADGLRGSVGLWIDEADYAATTILSESARAGRPKLSHVIDEEIGLAEGSIIVGTCGPIKLNVVVRNLVSRNIKPGRILKGDKRGHVAVFSEDFEM